MESVYDLCNDTETLEQLINKLQIINTELSEATQKMVNALQVSQGFLAGAQFEKARSLTVKTVEYASGTSVNINHAINFLKDLSDHITQYSSCKFKEISK